MKRIRSKIILAFVLLALVPALPLSILVHRLLNRSLAVGVNRNVEAALEGGVAISREVYELHARGALQVAKELAASDQVDSYGPGGRALPLSWDTDRGDLVELFNVEGKLLARAWGDTSRSDADRPPGNFAEGITDGALVSNLVDGAEATITRYQDQPGVLKAVAPIRSREKQLGIVVVTRFVPADFVGKADRVVETLQIFKSLDLVRASLNQGFVLAFLSVYGTILLLSLGVSYVLSRRITRPLENLAAATKTIGEGNLDYRVEVTSRDEIGHLEQSFNRMLSQIQDKQAQVLSLEKMAAWRQIARILAHEIKNPLTPIQLTVQELRDKYQGDDEAYGRLVEEGTQIVEEEISQLRTLVQEFSDFARMPEFTLAECDLATIVREVAALHANLNLSLDIADDIPPLMLDEEKMRRALINLIRNADEATGGRGEIRVRLAHESEGVLLEVADDGPGIPPEQRDKIFEPYFSTKKSGTGLGLPIVKRIVEQHGGRVEVVEGEDGGVCFRFRLPIKP